MSLDQELDDCLVGPVPVGINSFEFEAVAPNPSRIPPQDVLGVAALILTGSYNDQEFVRVGYYQNTEYDNEEMRENAPSPILFDRLVRNLSDKPRVTRFNVKWYGCAVFCSYWYSSFAQGCRASATRPDGCTIWASGCSISTSTFRERLFEYQWRSGVVGSAEHACFITNMYSIVIPDV